jgi:TRAP-type C4-dicarboxylate transport system substrate-binding protein
MVSIARVLLPILVAAAIAASLPAAAETQLRMLGQFLPTAKQYPVEKAILDAIDADEGLDIQVIPNVYKAMGLKTSDGLRLVRAGTFHVVAIQIGTASRDDAFLEGIDLIGVSTDMDSLRQAVDAYRDVLDARLQEKFNAKALAIWPFGPQVFYCNQEINSVADLEGLKVRSFTPSMSALLESLGATAVTLTFGEVYPALQRKVASCGVTSPTSGNTGKWPEVTTHQIPLSVSGSVQGYFANLDWWNGLTDDQRTGVQAAFTSLEDGLWETAIDLNADAIACNTGQDGCTHHQKFSMKLVEVSADDLARVKKTAEDVVLPEWIERCEASYPGCAKVWNDTVGKARGIEATAK